MGSEVDEELLAEPAEVVLRAFDPFDDSAMIFSTWRNSSYYSAASPHKKENDVYFKELTQKIRQILRRSQVRIACLADCPDIIIGYSVSENKHLHWIYVKEGFRKKGIGTLLTPKSITTVNPEPTKLGLAIAQKKNLTLKGDIEDE